MVTVLQGTPAPGMVLGRLWIGTIWTARHMQSDNPGAGLAVNCSTEMLPKMRGVQTLQLGLVDEAGTCPSKLIYVVQAVQTFLNQVRDRAVFVCCHTGTWLYPAGVLSVLLASGMNLADGIEFLHSRYPQAVIHPEVLESIRNWHNPLDASEKLSASYVQQLWRTHNRTARFNQESNTP